MGTKQNYKVVVLAAGKGSRLGEVSVNTSKGLAPLAYKPVLSHIIEKFPPEVEFVFALGYKKEDIRDFLSMAYPERRFRFVEVDNYDGPGSGPGYSLLLCRKAVGGSPFIMTTVDTLVLEKIPPPDEDWLGVAPVRSTKRFNSVKLEGEKVVNMVDKQECDNTHAFIGLCGIHSTELFWKSLQGDTQIKSGELQVSNGLQALVKKGMQGIEFTWFDTGDKESFAHTAKALDPTLEESFDFSKKDEFIYFVGPRVIKYFADEKISALRVERAGLLQGFAPAIERHQGHFYCYRKEPGQVLYAVLNDALAEEVLKWLHEKFWERGVLTPEEEGTFRKTCRSFYFEKTRERSAQYFRRMQTEDGVSWVNGLTLPPLQTLLTPVPWGSLCQGLPGRFHGDLQFDNILVTDASKPRFLLIDWRQNFGGSIAYGDIYYDLAKLYGGILLPYDLIKKGMFSCNVSEGKITFSVKTRRSLLRARAIFSRFVEKAGYDLERIKLLTALIYINMAPLHETPFNVLLHHLGKLELTRFFEKEARIDWLHAELD